MLYLLLQSTHKTEYINRIFEMDVDLQGCLMVQLQRVDHSLENYIEIKDILAEMGLSLGMDIDLKRLRARSS